MKTFYATLTHSHILHHVAEGRLEESVMPSSGTGCGYIQIEASAIGVAHELMTENFGRKWSMLYTHFDSIHEWDRTKLGELKEEIKPE